MSTESKSATPPTGEFACATCGGTSHYYRQTQCPNYLTTADNAVTNWRCILDARHEGPCTPASNAIAARCDTPDCDGLATVHTKYHWCDRCAGELSIEKQEANEIIATARAAQPAADTALDMDEVRHVAEGQAHWFTTKLAREILRLRGGRV